MRELFETPPGAFCMKLLITVFLVISNDVPVGPAEDCGMPRKTQDEVLATVLN